MLDLENKAYLLYSNEPRTTRELRVQQGTVIEILSNDPPGIKTMTNQDPEWILVREYNSQRVGFVPSYYVERFSQNWSYRVRVLFEFNGAHIAENTLSISVGDIILVIDSSKYSVDNSTDGLEDEWLFGFSEKKGSVGFFPRAFVEIIDDGCLSSPCFQEKMPFIQEKNFDIFDDSSNYNSDTVNNNCKNHDQYNDILSSFPDHSNVPKQDQKSQQASLPLSPSATFPYITNENSRSNDLLAFSSTKDSICRTLETLITQASNEIDEKLSERIDMHHNRLSQLEIEQQKRIDLLLLENSKLQDQLDLLQKRLSQYAAIMARHGIRRPLPLPQTYCKSYIQFNRVLSNQMDGFEGEKPSKKTFKKKTDGASRKNKNPSTIVHSKTFQ